MTYVLVGGKKRSVVLEEHLRRLNAQPEEGSSHTIASNRKPITSIDEQDGRFTLFPVEHHAPGWQTPKRYMVTMATHAVDTETGASAYVTSKEWKTWKNPGEYQAVSTPSGPFFFSILHGLYLAKNTLYNSWNTKEQGTFNQALKCLSDHFQNGVVLTETTLRQNPSTGIEEVVHDDTITEESRHALPLSWTDYTSLDTDHARCIAYTGFDGATAKAMMNDLFNADVVLISPVLRKNEASRLNTLGLSLDVKKESDNKYPFRFTLDASSDQYLCIPMTIVEMPPLRQAPDGLP